MRLPQAYVKKFKEFAKMKVNVSMYFVCVRMKERTCVRETV